MKRLAALLVAFSLTGSPCLAEPLEVVLRDSEPNWGGSCVYACVCHLLKLHGRHEDAGRVRGHCRGKACPHCLNPKLDALGVRYAWTFGKRDSHFLEWAVDKCGGCAVGLRTRGQRGETGHMVTVVYIDESRAVYVDPNRPEELQYVTRAALLAAWFEQDSWAVAILPRE